ncbi:MAG: hypothetical protein EOM20_17970 [Spartobacteria bacterium]|nr:hypothetical protein [Spartobacteria bacterium]
MSESYMDEIKKNACNPDNIPGIHNYCDKWCERCPFTARCAVFEMGQTEEVESLVRGDDENDAFWAALQKNLVASMQLIEDMARAHNIDLDELMTLTESEEEIQKREAADAHPLMVAAQTYTSAVYEWFENNNPLFQDKMQELQRIHELELPGANVLDNVMELNDLFDVIQWYHTIVSSKIHRAVQGLVNGIPKAIEEFPRDSDGSAKVALIAMDRSISAWTKMRDHFPERDDDIIDFLVQLERLRRATEKYFPEAWAFVRPGFDE